MFSKTNTKLHTAILFSTGLCLLGKPTESAWKDMGRTSQI